VTGASIVISPRLCGLWRQPSVHQKFSANLLKTRRSAENLSEFVNNLSKLAKKQTE
jgi:hypothetical protein